MESILKFETLSSKNWHLFEELFGLKGACGNCWCMHFRLSTKEHNEGKLNEGNKNKMKELVFNNVHTGMLAIANGKAIGWCAFAPREEYVKIENSRVHKRIDDSKVWSITCFFIAKEYRKKGLSVELIQACKTFAKQNNISILEAYPAIPTQEKLPDAFAWIGLYNAFVTAGFEIVDQTSKNRPMMRYKC